MDGKVTINLYDYEGLIEKVDGYNEAVNELNALRRELRRFVITEVPPMTVLPTTYFDFNSDDFKQVIKDFVGLL